MQSPLALRRSHSFGSQHQITALHKRREEQTKMTNEEILGTTVLNSWKLVISRFDKTLSELGDEQLHSQVAPGKNRVFYLLGHLTATHDRMLPLLGLGDRLHPELDDTYITNPDRARGDPLSATELRRAWAEVNNKLTAALEKFTLNDWLQKHTAVSDGDFVKDPTRNRLAVVISRTDHASYHLGQAVFAKVGYRDVKDSR
jgi:DinB superfamily